MAQPPWQNNPAEIAAALAASQATYAQEQSNAALAARRAENARLQNMANQANINKAIAASGGGGGGGGGGGRPRIFEPAAGEIPFKDIRPTGTDDDDGSPIWEDAFTQEEIGQGTVLIDFQMPDGRFISSLGRYILADQLDALLRRGTNPFATDLPLRIEDITQYRANRITGLKFARARGEALFRFAGDRGATIRFDADGTVGISESTRRLLEPSIEERLRMTKPEYERSIDAARNLNRRGNATAVAAWRRVGRGPLGRTDDELLRAVELERNPPVAAAARPNEGLPPGWVFKPYRRGPYAGKPRWYHYEHNTYTNRRPRGAFGLGELNRGNNNNENNNNNNDENNRPLARPTTPPIGSGRGGGPVRVQEDDNNKARPRAEARAGARAEVEDLVEIPIIGVRPSDEYVAGGGGGGSSKKNAKVGPNYNNPNIIRKNLADAVRDQDIDEALRLVDILHPHQEPIILEPMVNNGRGKNLRTEMTGMTRMLYNAVMENNLPAARLAIANRANLNIFRDSGHSLSRIACERGSPEILNLLLNNGIDIDITNDYKSTSLMVACRNESRNIANVECALLLISRGANVNLANKGGQTALWAALQPPPSPEKMLIVKALIARGATVNGKPGGPVSLARHRKTRKRKNRRNRTRKN